MEESSAVVKAKPTAVTVGKKHAGRVSTGVRSSMKARHESAWMKMRNAFLKRSVADQIEGIRSGVRAKDLLALAEALDVSQETIFRAVGISPSTAKRKLSKDENLDSATTERLVRVFRIEKLAEDVFGDRDSAREWLRTENLALGTTPLSMLYTDLGAQEVSRVLNAIAYGGAA